MCAMTFFEEELRKVVAAQYPDAVYAGRACYVRLSDMNRAKIQFASCGVAQEYPALGVTILNRQEGEVDHIKLRFGDILGAGTQSKDPVNAPFVWEYKGCAEWYGFQPSHQDYQAMSSALEQYLGLFQEQEQTAAQQWQQTMQ